MGVRKSGAQPSMIVTTRKTEQELWCLRDTAGGQCLKFSDTSGGSRVQREAGGWKRNAVGFSLSETEEKATDTTGCNCVVLWHGSCH